MSITSTEQPEDAANLPRRVTRLQAAMALGYTAGHHPAQVGSRVVQAMAQAGYRPVVWREGGANFRGFELAVSEQLPAPADAIDHQLLALRALLDRKHTTVVTSVDLQYFGRVDKGDLVRVQVHVSDLSRFDLRGFAWNFSDTTAPLETGPLDFVTVIGDIVQTKLFLGDIPTRVFGNLAPSGAPA